MRIPWLSFFTTWTSSIYLVSSTSVAIGPKALTLQAEPEVRLAIPSKWHVGSYNMNVTVVDALEEREAVAAKALANHYAKGNDRVRVVSSWILFHMPGNHTDALKTPTLPRLVGGLRDSLADAMEVCRSAVGIVDMRAINIDVIDKLELDKTSEKDVSQQQGSGGESILERAASLMRNMRSDESDTEKSHVNVTQIKATYEVRIFDEMKVSEAEVGRRIDKFQIYSRFSDLSRLLTRSLSLLDGQGMDGVLLDDVGYASKHDLWRPPLSKDDLADCTEEVSLHDARQIHQFIMAVALIMVALITCAGSTIFTIKHASSVPSRMNPLVVNDGDT